MPGAKARAADCDAMDRTFPASQVEHERSRFRRRCGYAFVGRMNEVLIFVIAGTGSREENQRQPALFAENEHLKLAAEPRRVPFDVAFVHGLGASILIASR